MTSQDELKKLVAKEALNYIKEGMNLGIGSGTTSECLIDILSEAPKPKQIVSSSERSKVRLAKYGFECVDLNQVDSLDLYIDGTDEFTKRLTLIKGGGGAHTREKIVAKAAKKFIVIADESKEVDVLGKFPVAVEVLPMAQALVARKIVALGGNPKLREGFITDENNIILDCSGFTITNAKELETTICSLPGVVDCGIFALRTADLILVSHSDNTVTKISM